MKHIKTFENFVNEKRNDSELDSLIAEGALASKYARTGGDLGDMDIDPDLQDMYDDICTELGVSDLSQVYQVDSETNEDDPLSRKIYNYLQGNLNPTKTIDKHTESMGVATVLDPVKNVIRYDEYGFVAFYFTADSKF